MRWTRGVDSSIRRLGDVEKAYPINDYAEGKDTGIVDLLLVGNINPFFQLTRPLMDDPFCRHYALCNRHVIALLQNEKYFNFIKIIHIFNPHRPS